jgi:hypothetical protein
LRLSSEKLVSNCAFKIQLVTLYTMGDKNYAREMATLLDPSGTLFNGRVIANSGGGLYKARIQLTHSLKPPGCNP